MKTKFALIGSVVAALALPAAAHAEYLIPPENSAASQYTESFPTSGGNRATNKGPQHQRTPAQVLGSSNARRIEATGPSGRAAARLAAATAPETGGGTHASVPATEGAGTPGRAQLPNGASGLAQALGHATGASSSGQLGLLLPLAIFGAIAWMLAYLWRQHRKPAT